MKTVLIGTLVVIFLAGALLLYNEYYVRRRSRRLASRKYNALEPLLRTLTSNGSMPEAEILAIAKDPSLRYALFRMLETFNRQDFFPAGYYTLEKGAESFLVNWLEFPTELGTAPDEIELFTKVTLEEGESLDYYVFKYRTNPPHWAAKYHWMIGVCGPYHKLSSPYDVPRRVFSRFNEVGSLPPETEVQWVHKNISP